MKFFIRGGKPLFGEIEVGGAKNAALPIFAATLLTDEPVYLKHIPDIKDIRTMVQMLQQLGKKVERIENGTYCISSSDPLNFEAPYELVRQMRASFLVLGPLLARLGKANVPLPGGCVLGPRPVDFHIKGLQALGAQMELSGGTVKARALDLHGAEIYLDYPSVGATEHLMMTAALIPEKTIINNPAQEPEVYDLANFLNKLGATIKIDHAKIEIEGAKELKGATHVIIPDRMNAGSYIIAGAITAGKVFVRCNPAHLQALLGKLREIGVKLNEGAKGVEVQGSVYKATEIETRPYPGFPTDLQPQMMALLSLASGESIIKETVFESRFSHVAELVRLGAEIRISGRSAFIRGVSHLEGTKVVATDIRAGVALVLAGLAARGETCVIDEGHICRGYSDLAGDLRKLGAAIEVRDE